MKAGVRRVRFFVAAPGFPPAAWILLALAAWAQPALAHIRIQLQGNHFLGSRKLKESIPLDPKKYDKESLATWKEDASFNVSDLYRRSGYFDVKTDLVLERRFLRFDLLQRQSDFAKHRIVAYTGHFYDGSPANYQGSFINNVTITGSFIYRKRFTGDYRFIYREVMR